MSKESVEMHLQQFGVADRLRILPDSIATVELAAAGLGVEPDSIAKTLAIQVKNSGKIMVVVTKGTARLDNAKFKARFGGKAMFISNDACLELTGHPPGGVCPFGLKNGVEVYLDQSLREFATVFPAAGSINTCLETSPAELEQWSGGEWVDLCRPANQP